MDKWTHCHRAREDADKINAMIAELHGDRELEFSSLHEAMVCAIYDMMLCKHEMRTADHEDWKDYNREMYNAKYPEDCNTQLTHEEAAQWVKHMSMPNGKYGEHWSIEDTDSAAKQYNVKFEHITPYEWYATMNMMYSDYYYAAKTGKPDELDYYVKMAKDFLFDEDGKPPHEKLYCYWKYVAKH